MKQTSRFVAIAASLLAFPVLAGTLIVQSGSRPLPAEPGAADGFTEEPGFTLSAPDGFTDGATITITGSGFGTKPGSNAQPLYFYDFGKTGTFTKHSLSRGTSNPSFTARWSITSAVTAPNREYAAMYTYAGSTAGAIGPWTTDTDGQESQFRMFVRERFSFDGADAVAGASDWNQKHFRYWGNSIGDNYILLRSYGQTTATGGNPRMNTGNPANGTDYLGGNTPHGIYKNQWREAGLRLQHASAPGVADGQAWTISQGIEHAHTQNPILEANVGQALYRNLYSWQEELAWADPATFRLYADVLYIEDSWCGIWVVDSATWSDVSEQSREPLLPKTWSDTQIEAEWRTGTFISRSGKTLYLTLSDNTKLKIGTFD